MKNITFSRRTFTAMATLAAASVAVPSLRAQGKLPPPQIRDEVPVEGKVLPVGPAAAILSNRRCQMRRWDQRL